jgi:hypothetical protein
MAPQRPHRWIALGLLLALLGWAGGAAADDDVRAAEDLARSLYYEGVPYDEARALSDAGVARLIEMLSDPDEVAHRSQIVEILGIRGGPGAFEALLAVAEEHPVGEVDGETWRTRMAVRAAMGHRAREDDRALAWLETRAAQRATPSWSHGPLRGGRLAGLLQRGAVTGLAISGRPEAHATLLSLSANAPAADAELRRHLDASLSLYARVRRDGPRVVFGRTEPER